MDARDDETRLPYLLGIPVAGLSLGYGIRTMYYAWGHVPGGDGVRVGLNEDFAHVGFSGLDNIGGLPDLGMAVSAILFGVALMVTLNRAAWRFTGGY